MFRQGFIHTQVKTSELDLAWIGQRPPASMPIAGGLMMLNRIKQGFSAPERIWKPSPALLGQGTLFSHPGSYNIVWSSLTWDMVIQQHSGGLFRHPSLCYVILVTEWQILEGRWLKYLTRARALPEITLHGSSQLHLLNPDWRPKSFTPTGDSVLRGMRPPMLPLPLHLQFLGLMPVIFNNSLMNEAFGKSGDCKGPSLVICSVYWHWNSITEILAQATIGCKDDPYWWSCPQRTQGEAAELSGLAGAWRWKYGHQMRILNLSACLREGI